MARRESTEAEDRREQRVLFHKNKLVLRWLPSLGLGLLPAATLPAAAAVAILVGRSASGGEGNHSDNSEADFAVVAGRLSGGLDDGSSRHFFFGGGCLGK